MASCPVKLSLWRGVAGFSLLLAAFLVFNQYPLGFVALLLGSLYFFKGCPACWLSGLADARKLKKQQDAEKTTQNPPDIAG
ncbi:MAG: hypothetical protein RBS08_02800 [Bdellovibrionales bacterium]|jgi:hypothetical protein|nr:hypothetical protein [Bdellovibrionales bacterium]